MRAIDAETRKRVRAGDPTPVEPWHLASDVALPSDLEADIEEEAMAAVSRGVPTPVGGVAWSAAKVPSAHTVVQGAEPGVVGASASAETMTVWEPEIGSLFD